MHLFCLHHAGGTTASFAGWRFDGVKVTKLGYRGRDYPSLGVLADTLAERIAALPSPRIGIYGHSMGAVLAFETALRLQHTGRLANVFLAAARPPSVNFGHGAAAALSSTALSDRAREVLLEDLALLATYPGRPALQQLDVPAAVLYSVDDPVAPPPRARRWAEWCAGTPRLIDVGGGGHLFHVGNPKVLSVVEKALSANATK